MRQWRAPAKGLSTVNLAIMSSPIANLSKANQPAVNLLIDQPQNPQTDLTVVLAHGAGAGMESDFMVAMAQGLCEQGVPVVRFEFPYMAQRRGGGSQRPPDKMPVLEAAFEAVLQPYGSRCVVAGKSLGGRVASRLLARQMGVAAIALGYPFHPPAKPDQLRNDHWPAIQRPWLIVQGSRDPFGTREEVACYDLPASANLHWLEDGDHDFKPRKRSGFTQAQHWQVAVSAMAGFVKEL